MAGIFVKVGETDTYKTAGADQALRGVTEFGKKLYTALSNIGARAGRKIYQSAPTTALALASWGLAKAVRSIQNNTQCRALIEDLMMNDPIIKQEDRDQVMSYYATIVTLSPTIAKDKNVVRELLQNFIKFGRVDVQTVQTLAKLENDLKGGSTSDGPNIASYLMGAAS